MRLSLGKISINYESLLKLFSLLLKLSSLLFVFSLLFEISSGSAWRYLYSVNLPICFIYLFLYFKTGGQLKPVFRDFLNFVKPYIPFILGVLLVFLIHSVDRKTAGFNLYGMSRVILISALVYACLQTLPRIRPKIFFLFASIGSFLFLIDLICLLFTTDANLWNVRGYTEINITEFGRMYSLFGGLSFLGFFYCKNDSYKYRAIFLAAGITGLLIPVFILYVRSVVLTTSIAIFCVFLLEQKKLKISKPTIVLLAAVFLIICTSVGPIRDRFLEGYQQSITVLDSNVFSSSSNNSNDALSLEKKKTLTTNFGARLAMWETAIKEFSESPIFGSGVGSPARSDSFKALYSGLGTYPRLPHFHSDYIQVIVVGGIVFFICLLTTQWLLFLNALKSPAQLFLLLSIITYGLVDLGFLLQSDFTVFIGAWVILSTWKGQDSYT